MRLSYALPHFHVSETNIHVTLHMYSINYAKAYGSCNNQEIET